MTVPESPDVAPGQQPESRRQLRGSTLLLSGRVLALLLNLVTQVVIVRALAKDDFGIFAYGLSLVTVARVLVGLGHNQAVGRFLAIYEERGDRDRLLGTLVMLVVASATLGSVLIGGLWLLRSRLEPLLLDQSGVIGIIIILAVLAPVQVVDDVFEAAFAVFGRPRAIFLRRHVMGPALRLVVVLLLVALDANLTFLAIGYVTAGAVGIAFYASALPSMLRQRGLLTGVGWRTLRFPVKDFYSFSVPLLTTELVYVSISTFTVVLLGVMSGATDVAEFRAVRPAVLLNQLIYTSFMTLFVPLAARLYERGDKQALQDAYWRTALWMTVGSFPIFALTVPFASATTETLFGGRYEGSAPYLGMMSAGYYLNVVLGFNAQVLRVAGRVRWLVGANVGIAASNIALSLALIPPFGPLGAAIANAATLIAQNVANQIGLRRLGFALVSRQLARAHAMIVAVTLVLAAAAWVLPPSPLVALPFVAVASAGIIFWNRSALAIGDVLPEVLRIPVVGRLLR